MAKTDGGTGTVNQPFGLPRWVAAILPIALLALVIAGFFVMTPFAGLEGSGAPLPDVTVTHHTIPNDNTLVLHVVNNGPETVTISQVLVGDAYWNHQVMQGGVEDPTIGPRESARVVIPYHWNPGWDLETALVLNDGTTIHHTIVAPEQSPGVSGDVLWTLAIIGLFVGVIPVALGMLWFPFMQSMSDRALHAILAFSVGILVFLAFDAGFEAFELAEAVPGAFEGQLLVIMGILGALLLVQAVTKWRSAGTGTPSGLWIAYMVALGIGLHNLAEGLAIGSAFALGRVSLGAFLVIGFMLHNVTEGPAVVAPVTRGARPSLGHFMAMGALAGIPVIFGGWIGSFAFSPTLGALFLAIGVGAILQVVWEIGGLISRNGQVGSSYNLLAFLAGLVIMYATDLLVVL
ncbi:MULTISPECIES: ZIP family metal transporter [unclassified Haladaptatus]|uniref:ZIP family metal transporter n=1 Tax=unclassified Haladaptatus TaxID=2622732 RepID=UPI0023E8C197|nr:MULTISPECIES: metal transporter [unclassified Haladaptatus]